jgi:signal transduction histidine kinase
MGRTRLRTKLLLSLIFTTALLTGTSLLAVQNHLRAKATDEIQQQIPNSFKTFEQIVRPRRELFDRSTAATAAQPTIQEMMTIDDAHSIQVASAEHWENEDCDLFVLADPVGRIMGFHAFADDFDRTAVRDALHQTAQEPRLHDWWFLGGNLYEVFLKPISRGPLEQNYSLGYLIKGFAVDERLVDTIAQATDSHVAFRYGDTVVATSLPSDKRQALSTFKGPIGGDPYTAKEIDLGGEKFVAASTGLSPVGSQPVTVAFLKSYDEAIAFLDDVNNLLLGVGLVALIAGSLLMFLIAHRLTHPLSKLASGVVALQKGDFSYPLHLERKDEVGELTRAFDTMRNSLKDSQQHLLHAERLATIGRMASTISHDLRHPLTAILAYAELLSEGKLDNRQRVEMYEQIRSSVNNMAELIASLLEFSKAQEALKLSYGDCVETLQDTIRTVKLKPEFRQVQMTLLHEGPTQGWFDFVKLERVFSNLLKNACEAVENAGRVRVVALGSSKQVEISVSDNGPGIPENIRNDVFQPFVTFGKADGTGLGLAVVQKIVLDHGGEVTVESTGSQGTTFKLILPLTSAAKSSVR